MSKRSPITCHGQRAAQCFSLVLCPDGVPVLDVMKGRPAAGIPVGLFQIEESPAAATHRLLATGCAEKAAGTAV